MASLAAGAVGAPRGVGAQWIRINQGGGEAGVEARDERSLDDGRRGASSTVAAQWLNLPLSGVIVSSRLLTYSINLRPTWGQQTVVGQPARYDMRSVGLGGSANFLPSALVSLGLHVERSSGGTEGGPGSRTKYASRAGGGVLRLRSNSFPIVADWNTRTTKDLWQASSDQVPVYRDETLRALRITGQSSKLRATLERLHFEDRVGVLGFSSIGGTAMHSLHWGKGSSLQSMLETLDRDGNGRQARRSLSERLFLQHTTAVASEYTVDRRRNMGSDIESSALAASALVRYQPRPWMTAGLKTSSMSSTFATGRVGSVAAVPNLRLEAKLPGGAALAGSVSAGYERLSQQLPSDSWIQVVDEPYTVDQSRVLVLAHERGDGATIAVHNPERTIAYLNGIDYRVSVLGQVVRIDVPLASRIAVGDAIVVSYRYAALTAGQFDVRSGDASLSFSIGGFSLTPSASLRRGRALDGGVGERPSSSIDRITSGDDYVLAAGFHHPTAIGRFDLDVSRRARENSPSDYTSKELRAGFLPRPFASVQTSVGASIARTATIGEDVRVVTSSATVNWSPTANTRVLASRESWLWAPRGRGAEETVIWNAELGWAVGNVEAELKYVVQRRAAAVDHTQRRLFGRFKRRF